MADTTTIARPYAKAAFEAAQADGALGAWSDMLNLMAEVTGDPAMRAFLANPDVENADKCQLVLDVCGDRLSVQGQNFVRILADNRRLPLVADIETVYELLRADAERTIEAQVVSARALTKEQEKRLQTALKKQLGREVVISSTVDEALLGGAIIRAGDLVIDGSATGKLHQLAAAMGQ
jgi:F-type H+-transporting ATPase subunit delta